MEKQNIPTDDFHFAKLIWQASGGATLLFLLTIPIFETVSTSLFWIEMTGLGRDVIGAAFLLPVFVFFLVFALSLFCLRAKQAAHCQESSSCKSCKPHFLLQFMVNFQASLILFLALLCLLKGKWDLWHIFFPSLGFLILLTLLTELCPGSCGKK
ncbi:MAG: hypothetical protein R2941_21925 [Desulfobacterales bacterium]